jgi:DNA-binding transcriptional ArsR family regulator
VRASPLPIFRSETQARILADLYLEPEQRRSVTEIAERLSIPIQTVQREIDRLEEAGLLGSRRAGRMRLVQANNQSPYFSDLRSLLVKAFGPERVLREQLEPVEGIQEAHIFGSWARQYREEHGPLPRDIDVLVVGDPDPASVHRACRGAEEILGRPVVATILTPEEWTEGDSGFLAAVRAAPRVEIELARSRER